MKQRGYVMLLTVFMLLGLGGVWFGGVALQRSKPVNLEALELESAKAALIHYAVNYIDHYGAQSAGPGHLPCPDTDKPDADKSDASLRDPWRLDGPNPPCGRNDVQFGWLPRHVNVITGRYHFHARSRQRLLYAVSTKHINNPVSRKVNPSTRSEISVGAFTDVIAILATPPLETDTQSIPAWFQSTELEAASAYTLIRGEELRDATSRRVAAWLLGKLNAALTFRCAVENSNDGAVDSGAENDAACIVQMKAGVECELTDIEQILHWLNTEPVLDNCEAYQEALLNTFEKLDSVPLNRHWFIRNEWFRFFRIEIDASCAQNANIRCAFALTHIRDGGAHEDKDLEDGASGDRVYDDQADESQTVLSFQPVASAL